MPKMIDITLKSGVKIGDKIVKKFSLREPEAGDLRGVKLAAVADMDTEPLHKLLPRISTPHMPEEAVTRLKMGDVTIIFTGLSDFFPKG